VYGDGGKKNNRSDPIINSISSVLCCERYEEIINVGANLEGLNICRSPNPGSTVSVLCD
jgi:hypothetical protein